MSKVFWFDLETTGLDCSKHALIQLAYIIEIDNVIRESGNMFIQPFKDDLIEDTALRVNKRSRDEMFKDPFLLPSDAFKQLHAILCKYVNKFDKEDKYYPAGYNVHFDCGFLNRFFIKNGDKYYGSFFNGRNLDPKSLMAFLAYEGKITLTKHALAEACEYFKVKHENAHDALSDVTATRDLMKMLWNKDMLFGEKK